MNRTVLALVGTMAATLGTVCTAPGAYAGPAPATSVTANIVCASGTSGSVPITPVDKNDYATGGTLQVGCGQFSPSTASETVASGTVSYNYNAAYYVIGQTTTYSCTGRARLGKSVTCKYPDHTTGITFSLTSP